jgi:ABC-type branched-subunit amino acid transport system substrate-binding protein
MRTRNLALAMTLCLALMLVGCGSQSGATTPTTVKINMFMPFSGPGAALSKQFVLPGVLAGQAAINAQGGILGQHVEFETTDSKGDAADAVLAANHLLNEQPLPVAIIGPATTEGPATVPLFDKAHLVMMSPDGGPELDHNTTYPYIYRVLPPDSVNGTAMSAAALKAGYTRGATMFASDEGSQTIVPGLTKSFEAHGGKIVINEQLPVDQPSYRTEITKMLAAHPQVIFTESDPQTAATFYSELQQIHGLTIPVYGSNATSDQAYLGAVANAIGGNANLAKFFTALVHNSPDKPGGAAYTTAFKSVKENASIDAGSGVNANFYDAMIVLALAMTEAKSTDPLQYASHIKDITNNTSYTPVNDYASGLQALKAGKKIYYDGASGPMNFNQFNYVTGDYDVAHIDGTGHVVINPGLHLSTTQLSNYAP